MLHFLNRKELQTKTGNFVDHFAVPIAIITSFVTVPQVWNVWVLRQVEGVSLLTFGLFFVGNLFWFSYGLHHSDKAIMVSNLTGGILNVIIVTGRIVI